MGGGDWMDLAQDVEKLVARMNTAMKFRVQ
jgi:hypothetical protein